MIIGVIPSRFASTRLPGKPLIELAGKPLVQWVWEAAKRCQRLDNVLVATDDERIAAACRAFGADVVMTPAECPSGTDRISAALEGRDADVVVNIQGDEPLMEPATVDACVAALVGNPGAAVSSAMTRIDTREDYLASHVVKVVVSETGRALYFSRAPIPDSSRLTAGEQQSLVAYKHLGLYVYRRAALEQFIKLRPSRYEQAEKLEQLRFLEAGFHIQMVEVESGSVGVDTPEDVEKVEKLLLGR
ncbi:MAG: 3-deoxy-manno-octulosonate cytidylyltransferase [Candidatus Sumerlaeaceae bacterium]